LPRKKPFSADPVQLPGVWTPSDGERLDADTLLQRLKALPPGILPLQAACTRGGIVDETRRQVGLAGSGSDDDPETIGFDVFFSEVVGGCNCHDDPAEFPCVCRLEARLERDGDRLAVTVLPID
jgi:hypothetical protein